MTSPQQPTHAPAIRHRTHGVFSKPIARMVSVKAMRTAHTKHHEAGLSVLALERLVAALARGIRGAQPQHA